MGTILGLHRNYWLSYGDSTNLKSVQKHAPQDGGHQLAVDSNLLFDHQIAMPLALNINENATENGLNETFPRHRTRNAPGDGRHSSQGELEYN